MSVPDPATTDWVPLNSLGADFEYKGDWAAGTYEDGDIAIYNGIAYLCVGGPTTVVPDPTLWGAALLSPAIGYGTSFPASPIDGQEHILVDNVITPTYSWRFRYVASRATNKWVFIGGSPLTSEVATSETTNSTSYVALATPGPIVTVPIAGEYFVEHGFQLNTGAGSAFAASMSFDIGATAAVDTNSTTNVSAVTGQGGGACYRRQRLTLAAVALTSKYKVNAGTCGYSKRWMSLNPIAVGG